jgi:amino acid carrier protein
MGAIFWMWVSALLGMSTIFSEAVLAQKYKKEYHGETVGGSAYYLYYGLGSKWLAVCFSVAIVLALGFVGNMVQANSISIALNNAFHIPSYIIGIVLAAVVGVVIIGGQRRITAIAELLVPFMAVVYILGSLVIIYMFADQLPHVIRTIFQDAFSMKSAAGGAAGTVMKYAIRYGVARGLFSNEAGMGSTPHAHALADVKDPSEQGFVAMAGVFVDTVLICTSTAFVIMLTGSFQNLSLKSVAITQEGFEIAFGNGGIIFLAISLIFFAFTTIIGWYMFAEMNIKFMFGKKGILSYRALVVLFVFLGCLFAADMVWELADTFNGLMVIPNLIGIIFLAPQVKKIYKNFLANRKENNS